MQNIQNGRGYLKFSDQRTSLDQLKEFAQELAQDQRFISVYIRKVSSDQHGIGFVTTIDTSTQDLTNQFFDEIKDKTYKKFGTALVGWDMSGSYILIK